MLAETLLCLSVALASGETPARGGVWTCLDIVAAAERADVPPVLAAVVGWHETRWRDGLVSSAGACGPMQTMPIHGACTADTGVQVLRRYILRRWRAGRPLAGSICDYACGPARRYDSCRWSRERLGHVAEVVR